MREKSYNSADVKVFRLNYEHVLNEIKKYAAELVDKGLAELVILIGSLARGNYTPFSDIDIVIVVKDDFKDAKKSTVYFSGKLPLDLEPRILTESEFLKLALSKRRIARETLEEGIYLAGRRDLLDKARELLNQNTLKTT